MVDIYEMDNFEWPPNVFMLFIKLYINYFVMPIEVDNKACSDCFISHTRATVDRPKRIHKFNCTITKGLLSNPRKLHHKTC